MIAYRPPYMSRSPIAVFQKPTTNSVVIFSVVLGTEVEILERNIRAIDQRTGAPYRNKIVLHKIRHDGKEGFVNKRWLR